MENGLVQSATVTTTATGAAALVSLTASTYRSVDYQVQAVKGSSYNTSLIKVVHDGTNTYMTEFGNVNQPSVGIATFSTDINSGDLRLLGFPSSSDSTVFKIIFSAIKS
jgi:hypothetical protein|tara:strand:+ start:301 stop:627 length:327 start_codon:yes stop_codon:yes gene_type:complete